MVAFTLHEQVIIYEISGNTIKIDLVYKRTKNAFQLGYDVTISILPTPAERNKKDHIDIALSLN